MYKALVGLYIGIVAISFVLSGYILYTAWQLHDTTMEMYRYDCRKLFESVGKLDDDSQKYYKSTRTFIECGKVLGGEK